MDEVDCRILQELQGGFPVSERPYELVAERLSIPCEELWGRIHSLLGDGVIRRMGISLDYSQLGFSGTLAAVSIEPHRVNEAARVIGAFDEVTHCYLRKDRFNIWFTIIAPDKQNIAGILEQIRSALALEFSRLLNLPAKQVFKLDARFAPSL